MNRPPGRDVLPVPFRGEWLVRLACRLMPADLRQSHGDEILDLARADRARARDQRRTVLGFWILLAPDLVRAIVRAHRPEPFPRLQTRQPRPGGWAVERGLARRLVRDRVALGAAALLAVGLACALTIFSLVDAALLRPLPFVAADRLVHIDGIDDEGRPIRLHSEEDFADWRARQNVFDGIAAVSELPLAVDLDGRRHSFTVAQVSGDFFEVLGTAPALGRAFGRPEENRDDLVVLSHGFWSAALGGRPGVLGSRFSASNRTLTVIGVMPEGFRYPLGPTRIGRPIDAWIPKEVPAPGTARDGNWVGRLPYIIGRVRTTVPLADAEGGLSALTERLKLEYPGAFNPVGDVRLTPLRDSILGAGKSWIVMLSAALGLLLLLSCLNVAGLLACRLSSRALEWWIRRALGAGTARIAVHQTLEAAAVVAAGTVGGIGLAWAGIAVIRGAVPENVVLVGEPALTGFGIGLGLAAGFAIVAAFVPLALLAERPSHRDRARPGGDATGVVARVPVGGALVGGQMILATVLMTGTLSFALSFGRLAAIDIGFDPTGVAAIRVSAGRNSAAYGSDYLPRLAADATRLPGQTSVAASATCVPFFDGCGGAYDVTPPGRDRMANDVEIRRVTDRYFDALGMTMLYGRLPAPDERTTTAVLNERAMRRYLGQTWRPGSQLTIDGDSRVVTGVVADVLHDGPESPARLEAYVFESFSEIGRGFLVARTTSGRTVSTELSDLVASAIPEQVAPAPIDYPAELSALRALRRFTALLAAALGLSSVLAAGAGVSALMAFVVGRRRREIGIRLALGGSFHRVAGAVVRREATAALAGVVAGSVLSAWMFALVEAYLFEAQGTDRLLALPAVCLLAGIIIAAALVPAAAAGRTQPTRLLRMA